MRKKNDNRSFSATLCCLPACKERRGCFGNVPPRSGEGIEAVLRKKAFPPLVMLLFALTSLSATAQKKDLKPEEIEVVKDYTPFLADAVKFNFPAAIPERGTGGKLELIYSTPEKTLPIPFQPAPLKPLAIGKQKPEQFSMNYFKLGFGTQLSPLFEALWNDRRFAKDEKYEKYNYGFFARHFSSRGFKINHQDYSENHFSVFLNFFAQKAQINSQLAYHRECVRYYGYNHDTIAYDKKDVKQHFNNFSWNTGITNIQNKKIFQYNIRFGYDYFADRNKIRESNPWVSVNIHDVFRKKHHVSLKATEDYSLFKNGITLKRNIFSIKPVYEFNNQIWRVFGGFDMTWENGIFHFFPELGLERQLYEKYILLYNGWRMELKRTSFKTLTDDNPWLGENFTLRNTWFEDRYIGLKGTVHDFTYNLRFAQKLVRRLPLFINDTTDSDLKKFTVIYDVRTSVLNFHAELFYHITQDWNLSATLEYNHYEMDEVEKPWHLPNFVFDFNTQYSINKKVYLTFSLLARDGVIAKLPENKTKELKGTLDANVGASYKYNKHFSFFLNLNNLASVNYEMYYRYPSYGFNALAGVTFTY